MIKPKLVRITTVPISMNIILKDQLHFMNRFFEVIGVTGYDEKHFNEIREREGIRMYEVGMARNINLLQDLHALWKIFKFLKKEKPEIVHTHTPKAGLLGMIAARYAGVPVRFHTVAGMPLLETKGAKRWILKTIEKITYSCAHMIYPNSHGLQRIILDNNFCSPKKIKVLANGSSNGINLEYFSSTVYNKKRSIIKQKMKQYGIAENDFIFCFVGRLAKEKGILELVEAFENLCELIIDQKGLKLLLVGPFEKFYGALSEATCHRIYANPNIVNVGRHDDIRPFLMMSDVFVFPSYREGFPGVVLQAGAMGLPSIVSNINGCNEVIVENKNGILVDPKNAEVLKQAMVKLLKDPELTRSLASKARQMISKFNREIIWEELLKEYNRYCNVKIHTNA